ncbi:leucine-rich repeat and fibronectin type-III domain-containing protein 4-like [Cloeon dipterum]|uniref:leucine-rich repeat and fibronectin type-III domain-containing protein 4-like n=1 Tax=Cloeon dipterum TaxID=197152 RepID=UPI003220146A
MWLPAGALLALLAVVSDACPGWTVDCPALSVANATEADILAINATLLCRLTLRKGHLHALPTLEPAGHLRELDASENALRVLPPVLHFPALRTLNLSHNALTTLPINFLSASPCVTVLDVSHNQLAVVSAGVGLARRRTTHVSLAHNRIVRVDPGALENAVVSRTLDLSHNRLRRFPGDALRRARHLASVSVAFNCVRRLQRGETDDISVGSLDISGQLERIDADAFRNLPALENLTLTHSPGLRFIPADAFGDALPSLRVVNLSGNALLGFERPPFWIDVRVDASGNAFVCHCAHHWLNITCAEASCAPLVLPLLPETAAVALGGSLELRCIALGAERVRWLRADDGIASDTSRLRLTHAGREAGGLFTCVASNALGLARRSVRVSVKDPNVRLFVLSVSATFVTLAWNMSGAAPYVLRWGADAAALDNASPTFPPAPRAHSYAVHGLRPATAYCFALSLDADVTLDRTCVTTAADGLVGVERSYAAIAALGLAAVAALAACVALCVINARPTRTVRRVELIESVDAAFFIELD